MWVFKLFAFILYAFFVVWVVNLFYEFATRTKNKDDLCVGELCGAALIGVCFAALFGALIQPNLAVIMIVAGLISCACWVVVLCFKGKPNRIQKAMLLSVRMLGTAGILATVMLPFCRFAA